jgi:hypothetical protein
MRSSVSQVVVDVLVPYKVSELSPGEHGMRVGPADHI